MSETKVLIVSTHQNGHPPVMRAVQEGWRCRHCAGTRSQYDLMKADGLCARCRSEEDREESGLRRVGLGTDL